MGSASGDALIASKVRGSLWQHLAREARVVRGPQLKTPERVEEEVLRDHVSHCGEHAITAGDSEAQREKVLELWDLVRRG